MLIDPAQAAKKARAKAWAQEYYRANKEKILATTKAWQKANPDKVKAYQEANRDRIRVRRAVYCKEWRWLKRYPGSTRADYQRYQDTTHCQCCGVKLETAGKHAKRQDFCHATGKLRGVICHSCHTLARLLETPQRAAMHAAYKARHTQEVPDAL